MLRLLFCLPLLFSSALAGEPNTLDDAEKKLGFELLFDGQSLDGWTQSGNWDIDDRAIHRQSRKKDITYSVKPVPDDFELRFDWKVAKGCNSGLYYRPRQYEYQVLDNANSPYGENPRQNAAALYSCMAPTRDVTRPFGSWNEARIVAKGTVIQHWLNGVKVVDFDYSDPRWANEIAILRRRGAELGDRGAFLKLQDHGEAVWFRSLRWRVIPADEKLVSENLTPMLIPPEALAKEIEHLEDLEKPKVK